MKWTHLLKALKIDHYCSQIFSGGLHKRLKSVFWFLIYIAVYIYLYNCLVFCCVSRNWMTICKYCLIFSIPAFILKRFQDGEGLEMIWCTFQWSLQESIQMDSFWKSKLEIETCPIANIFLWNVIYGFLPVLVMEVVCFITIHPKKSLHLFHCAFFLFLLFPPLLCQRRHHYYHQNHHDH